MILFSTYFVADLDQGSGALHILGYEHAGLDVYSPPPPND